MPTATDEKKRKSSSLYFGRDFSGWHNFCKIIKTLATKESGFPQIGILSRNLILHRGACFPPRPLLTLLLPSAVVDDVRLGLQHCRGHCLRQGGGAAPEPGVPILLACLASCCNSLYSCKYSLSCLSKIYCLQGGPRK